MTANVANQVAFLRTSREYPEDPHMLSVEVNKTYLDIAQAVNNRTIGIYPVNRPVITGNNYFITGSQRQQSLRQFYSFSGTSAIPHGINLSQISRFVQKYGDYTDGTNWYGLMATTNIAIPGQISFYLDPTNINFLIGAGAPSLTTGTINLEWISVV